MMPAPFRSAVLALGTALALGACATGGRMAPTQVTRFHLGQPIAPGTVAVEPRPGVVRGPEFDTYAAIVGGELTRLGFRQGESVAASELVAVVDVTRASRPSRGGGSGLSIGIGGGGFSGGGRRGGTGVGVGGGVSFPVGSRGNDEIVGTQLSVQLKRRSDGTVIWEGRARNEARGGSPAADPDQSVRTLAAAVFQGFPGESGRTITVK